MRCRSPRTDSSVSIMPSPRVISTRPVPDRLRLMRACLSGGLGRRRDSDPGAHCRDLVELILELVIDARPLALADRIVTHRV